MELYVLKTPASVVVLNGQSGIITTFPRRSIVALDLPLNQQQGLIGVSVNGKAGLMFAEDIRQRGRICRHHTQTPASGGL